MDEKLRQFRKVNRSGENPSIDFMDFDSEEGEELLKEIDKAEEEY